MKILFDSHMLGKSEGGNERYALNLLKHLGEKREIEVFKVVSKDFNSQDYIGYDQMKNFIPLDSDNSILRVFYYLPKIISRIKPDIIHSTYISPFVKNVRSVVTVHDLLFKRHPEFFSTKERLAFAYLLPISLKLAGAIIVPSEFTKKELLSFYPQYRYKTFITAEAAEMPFRRLSKKEIREKKIQYEIENKFILTINSKNPKKNINIVIKAFLEISKNKKDLRLIIIGGDSNIGQEYKDNNAILILDYISEEHLILLYNSCELFVYLSIYEGFGLPLVEAIKCGACVIASDTEVHRETTNNSILYSDPNNYRKLSKLISYVLNNNGVKRKVIHRSQKIITNYSWKNTASRTVYVYKFVLKNENSHNRS